jgi:hypothetical protein
MIRYVSYCVNRHAEARADLTVVSGPWPRLS